MTMTCAKNGIVVNINRVEPYVSESMNEFLNPLYRRIEGFWTDLLLASHTKRLDLLDDFLLTIILRIGQFLSLPRTPIRGLNRRKCSDTLLRMIRGKNEFISLLGYIADAWEKVRRGRH